MPASDELLHVITNASEMFIAYVDREQRYRFVNTMYKQHFGGGSDQMIGMRVSGERGAAKILGIKPTTLEGRMKKLGVKRPD